MPRTLCPTATPRYRRLFAVPEMDQPAGFFLLENLLIARAASMFPTNGAGPDEDVNVYLAHLLGKFLNGKHNSQVRFGSEVLFNPPAASLSRRAQAAYYQSNADHRLLYLGLFGWGDGLRRRNRLATMTGAETHTRDLLIGKTCYSAAAQLLRGRRQDNPALVAVWTKLAANFEDYVHVLGALATRQLGLGAQLGHNDLARLLPTAETADEIAVQTLLSAPPPDNAHDALLDLWLAHQKNPDPMTAARIRAMANRLGVELQLD